MEIKSRNGVVLTDHVIEAWRQTGETTCKANLGKYTVLISFGEEITELPTELPAIFKGGLGTVLTTGQEGLNDNNSENRSQEGDEHSV